MNFTILGERHSGTNFLQGTIEQNFDLSVTWDYGWKHWMGFNDEKIKNANDTIFFCISRNIFDWCYSFYLKPHHVEHMKELGAYGFLTEEWFSMFREEPLLGNTEIIEDRNYETNERYKNIFELRSMKLKYMYTLKNMQKNTFNLTYENLCNNYDDVMYDIGKTFNLERIPNSLQVFQSTHKPPFVLLDLITDKTDWEAELLWGYKMKMTGLK